MSRLRRRVSWTESSFRLPVLSGALLALAYFPFDLLIFNFVAFLPILFWLDAGPRRPAELLRGGLFFGMTVHLAILHWMLLITEVSPLWAPLYLLVSALFGLAVMVSIGLAGRLRRRTGGSFVWILPVCWLPLEWLATFGDTRMTAHHVGHTLAGYPFLVQFADLFGTYGVGLFLLVSNALIYEAVRDWRRPAGRRRAAAMVALLAVVLAYDGWRWSRPPEPRKVLRVAYVQPNIPLAIKHDDLTNLEQWAILESLSEQAAAEGVDLIVWPESAHPWGLWDVAYRLPRLELLARRLGTPILTGVVYGVFKEEADHEYYNAAVVIDREGVVSPEWTAKTYLVPFTERTPFADLLHPLLENVEGEWRWMAGDFMRAPGPKALTIDGGDRIGVLVCYEELFWDLSLANSRQGADIQAVITNDAWFGRTVWQWYQTNTVRLRAIETRSAFVRAANTGISGFVDPLGRYHGLLGLFEQGYRVGEMDVVDVETVYERVGDVVIWPALAGLLVGLVLAGRRKDGGPR